MHRRRWSSRTAVARGPGPGTPGRGPTALSVRLPSSDGPSIDSNEKPAPVSAVCMKSRCSAPAHRPPATPTRRPRASRSERRPPAAGTTAAGRPRSGPTRCRSGSRATRRPGDAAVEPPGTGVRIGAGDAVATPAARGPAHACERQRAEQRRREQQARATQRTRRRSRGSRVILAPDMTGPRRAPARRGPAADGPAHQALRQGRRRPSRSVVARSSRAPRRETFDSQRMPAAWAASTAGRSTRISRTASATRPAVRAVAVKAVGR